MSKEKSKYDIDERGRTYGYDKKGGWDIDTSDRTQRTSDSGHIPGRYQWEETVDVSDDEEDQDFETRIVYSLHQYAKPLVLKSEPVAIL